MRRSKTKTMISILISTLILSCSFFDSKEFSYRPLTVEEYDNENLKFKDENFATLGIKKIKYETSNNLIYVPVYMSSSGGREFVPIIMHKNDTLFLSVQYKPNSSGEVTDEKIIYFFEYNILLEDDQSIDNVVFIHPNYKRKK
jgi:hypothetical protein